MSTAEKAECPHCLKPPKRHRCRSKGVDGRSGKMPLPRVRGKMGNARRYPELPFSKRTESWSWFRRAGGRGARFNFGEMTMTKCIVGLEAGTAGHAYIAGSDAAHAEMAAVMDAMLQEKDSRDRIMSDIIIPLQQDLRDANRRYSRKWRRPASISSPLSGERTNDRVGIRID